MKISAEIRAALVSFAKSGPLRRALSPALEGVILAELALERMRDEGIAAERGLESVTAIVKTFERPDRLALLLESFRRRAPSLRVIVADDSASPSMTEHAGIEVIRLPFDVGVSAGRAAALARVTTPYVVSLDDDFVLHRGTRFSRVLAYLDRNPDVDLVAGDVLDLPFFERLDSLDREPLSLARAPKREPGTRIDGLAVVDVPPNFFVARTEAVRRVGWDPVLRRLDHSDFFTRARGELLSVLDPAFTCLHAKTPLRSAYLKHRLAYEADRVTLGTRYPT